MHATFLNKLFRAPAYLSLFAAGVAVRNDSIAYLEFSPYAGSPRVRAAGTVPLPAGVVKDGEVVDRPALVAALGLVKKKLSTAFVCVAIPEGQAYVFDVRVPREAAGNLREAVEFKLEENVPFPAADVSFECELAGEAGGDAAVRVSAAPAKIVADLADACIAAGLAPVSFEIESQMIARAVVPAGDERPLLLVNVGESSTLLAFVAHRSVAFASTIGMGGAAMRESARKADPDRYAEFERAAAAFPSPVGADEADAVYSMFNVFSIFKDELERFIGYVSSKAGEDAAPIEGIILSGRAAALPGFAGHIGQNIGAPVSYANVWANAFRLDEYLPPVTFAESLDLASAVGLAMPTPSH